jgi:hypothetical protein
MPSGSGKRGKSARENAGGGEEETLVFDFFALGSSPSDDAFPLLRFVDLPFSFTTAGC